MRVAGLDVGGSSVKAWVRELDGPLLASATVPTATLRPAAHRAEFDPAQWQAACRQALTTACATAGRGDYAGLTVGALRQGFLLLGADGEPLGNGVLNSDRRGGPYAGVLTGRHALTGHWPAPELTLPKLLAIRAEEPDRWAATVRVLFVHDWLLWLLAGVQVTEASYACAGGMADVAARGWAVDLLAECGIGGQRLAPVVESGLVVGALLAGWPLPAGLPVVSGCGDTQLAAVGAGGLGDAVLTVVAGSSTPVQVASQAPVRDPLGRPWVSTHASPELWAAETNAGYPGTWSGWWAGIATVPPAPDTDPGPVLAVTATPYWSEQTWAVKPPAALIGMTPDTTAGQVARALVEAHAFAIRGNIEDVERALGRPAGAVVLTGGGATGGALPVLLAQVLGRDVHLDRTGSAAIAGCYLVARALGADPAAPGLPAEVVAAGDPAALRDRYERWRAATEALRTSLGE